MQTTVSMGANWCSTELKPFTLKYLQAALPINRSDVLTEKNYFVFNFVILQQILHIYNSKMVIN
jgi:hypothetical protein